MDVKGKIEESGMVLVLAGFIPVNAEHGARNAVEFCMVGGIIEYAGENSLVVKDKLHDITGVPVLDMNGETIHERGVALLGKAAAVLYRNGQLISVKIFPVKQQESEDVKMKSLFAVRH